MRIQDDIEIAYEPVTESGCWIWMRAITSDGYGKLKVDGRLVSAHRYMYSVFVGKIPDGLHVLHKCDIRCCVNPTHLFLGTNADNVADKVAKGRQHRTIGETNGRCRLSEAQVVAIRADTRLYRIIAHEYGVAHSTVGNIKIRAKWRHVPKLAKEQP